MNKNKNSTEGVFWEIVFATTVIVIGACLVIYYLGYIHGKNKFFNSRYEDGFYNCDKLWKDQIKKKEEEQKKQITKDTKLILYYTSKSFPEVNTTKYTLYNDNLKLSASYNVNEGNGKSDYSNNIYYNENDLILNMLKNDIAKQLTEKFVIERVNE